MDKNCNTCGRNEYGTFNDNKDCHEVGYMTKPDASEELINKLIEVDSAIRKSISVPVVKAHVLQQLEGSFDFIVSEYPNLVEEVQERIVNYYKAPDPSKVRKITDFMDIAEWFSMCLKDADSKEYWDPSHEYHSLRMSEPINGFLTARALGI